MSGHIETHRNSINLAQSSTTATTTKTPKNDAVIIDSRSSVVVGPLSSLDNNIRQSVTNNISTQQILSNQIELFDSSRAAEVVTIDSLASVNNRHNELSESDSAGAIDFFGPDSDKVSSIGDSWKSFNKTNRSNQSSLGSHSNLSTSVTATNPSNRPQYQASHSGARFESLLPSASDELVNSDVREIKADSSSRNLRPQIKDQHLYHCDINNSAETSRDEKRHESQFLLDEPSNTDSNFDQDNNFDESDDEIQFDRLTIDKQRLDNRRHNKDYRAQSPSYFKRLQRSFSKRLLSPVNRILGDSSELDLRGDSSGSINNSYAKYEDKDLLTGTSKYNLNKRSRKLSGSRTFRGSYKYSRTKISMAILKKMATMLVQRSTLALFGAFLIHITLGTVYTLSNINSYLTSYMRKHGSPNATYGGSMWMSSLYAIGQGFSMVLGGYIEKRYSARVACMIGCALHSISIICTSWSVNYGTLAVLVTYGLIPGFGCGLAYMTPMSNGFGWFPNRKGLVAGVILAGFGIGTFIFNMAQTAYVNPDNLSPPDNSDGYFIQKSVLDKVPHLFVFTGSIYAAMQFVGCCLLFKPPNTSTKGLDERPILVETEIPLKRSIQRREFIVLFLVYGITTQGILFVNSMLKEYGQIFIGNDMYLAWTGSMASIANSLGRLAWGLAIDRFSFTQCFTSITLIFGSVMFIMPFEFILSSKLLYLLCTLGIFGSFSGWMSTYPVHLSRVFGRTNSGMIYGLIFISQSVGGIFMALGSHYLIDHYSRFVPFFCVVLMEIIGLAIYHLFYPK